MKQFLLITILIIFFSCGQTTTEKGNTNTRKESNGNSTDDTTIIKNFIIEHYKTEYEKTKPNDPEERFTIDMTEEGISLVVQHETYGPGDMNTIPFSQEFIKGDLNGDKLDDYVIPVYSGSGGLEDWLDIFLFVKNKGKLDFVKKYTSFSLANCQKKSIVNGQFYPENITNGVLVGKSTCYKRSDSRCCPSENFLVQYKFENGLVLLSKTKE